MAEKGCSSFNSSAASNMDAKQQDNKDVSKVFAYIRNKLNAKEKELLGLQRAEPCLLAPDSKQIDTLLDYISSLHLSTQDGSFIFASTSKATESSSSNSTTVCSTGVDSIKTLPATSWLSGTRSVQEKKEQENQYRLPMVSHLLSLPANAYVKSSSSSNSSTPTPVDTNDQPSNRLPMVSQLLSMPINAYVRPSSSSNCSTSIPVDTNDQPSSRLPMVSQLLSMPINAFKSSSSSDEKSSPVPIEEKKETVNNEVPSRIISTPQSILSSETVYSKEHWLNKSSPSESEFVHLDLDDYIEQSTEKMRRLHTDYLQALEKLKTPSNPTDSSQTMKSLYPQMFARINEDLSTKGLARLLPSKK